MRENNLNLLYEPYRKNVTAYVCCRVQYLKIGVLSDMHFNYGKTIILSKDIGLMQKF